MRRAAKEKANPSQYLASRAAVDLNEHYKNNFSYNVPRYSFITVMRHDGVRMYIRCHSETYLKDEVKKISGKDTFSGVMGSTFKDIWTKAGELVSKL